VDLPARSFDMERPGVELPLASCLMFGCHNANIKYQLDDTEYPNIGARTCLSLDH